VTSATVDTVTNIFAPCAPAEYTRVLKTGGHLIVAGAGERHLFDLKRLIYDDPYLNDGRSDLPKDEDAFVLADKQTVSFTARVEGQAHVAALFSMTPYYWRTSRVGHERLSRIEILETEVSFDFYIYRRT
jgi:23S rRNA (guanine745-N1)-methyltransferase